jgi:hypothetical protein
MSTIYELTLMAPLFVGLAGMGHLAIEALHARLLEQQRIEEMMRARARENGELK